MSTNPIKPTLDSLRRRTLAQAREALHPARVLLAEDDLELRTLLATSLWRRGYEVTEVSDAAGLLEELGAALVGRRGPTLPDIVVSDVRMPGRTGIDVLAGLRAAAWAPPFVFITAFGDQETHARVASLGAVLYDKPFDIDELCSVVARTLVQA